MFTLEYIDVNHWHNCISGVIEKEKQRNKDVRRYSELISRSGRENDGKPFRELAKKEVQK